MKYDGFGRQSRWKEKLGTVTNFRPRHINARDSVGRLVSSTSDMGGTARTVSTLYDRDGNRTRFTHPDLIYVTYDLDGLGRPTWVRCYGNDPVTGFTYDDLGRRSTMA
jgi:hypothetical protein